MNKKSNDNEINPKPNFAIFPYSELQSSEEKDANGTFTSEYLGSFKAYAQCK